MTFEFKAIIKQAKINELNGLTNVLATVVFLEGSSYRKPGVRMLMANDGSMTGAISGGCVEKEVLRRAQSVFETGIAKVITYDGSYRLGCEGVLYILLEPFSLANEAFKRVVNELEQRNAFQIHSLYVKADEAKGSFGSYIQFQNGDHYVFSSSFNEINPEWSRFSESLQPNQHLLIIGAEHDAVQLSKLAGDLGWDVEVICSLKNPKSVADFPAAKCVTPQLPELVDFSTLDQHTAVVIMNHSFSLDLKYLLKLQEGNPSYIGIIGSHKKGQKLSQHLLEINPSSSEAFFDKVHTPAGLNLGAVTPQEIALSVLAEIMTVVNRKDALQLKKYYVSQVAVS